MSVRTNMKPHKNMYYKVTAPNMWWVNNKVGWINDGEVAAYKGSFSSCRIVSTYKRAVKAICNLPTGSVLHRVFCKKGKRYIQEFVKL